MERPRAAMCCLWAHQQNHFQPADSVEWGWSRELPPPEGLLRACSLHKPGRGFAFISLPTTSAAWTRKTFSATLTLQALHFFFSFREFSGDKRLQLKHYKAHAASSRAGGAASSVCCPWREGQWDLNPQLGSFPGGLWPERLLDWRSIGVSVCVLQK